MNTLEAIYKSIAHWERMYRASKNLKGIPTMQKMFDVIQEDWSNENCELCKIYYNSINGCSEKCPLIQIDNYCGDNTNIWAKVERALFWHTWRFHAREMISVLKKALKKSRKEKR